MRRPTTALGGASSPGLATSGTAGTAAEFFRPFGQRGAVRLSTAVLLIGLGLFALPVPGTFIGGGLVLVAGGGIRYLGE